MGLLRSIGVRTEARRLRPFLRTDEYFSECDVCDVPVVAWRDGQRQPYGKSVMSLTSHAVYLRPLKAADLEALRIPYARLVDLQAARGMVELVTRQANYLITDVGQPMIPDKYATIRAHIQRIEVHSQTVEVPGGVVHAVCRPFDEDQSPEWMLVAAAGVDVSDPAVKTTLVNELAGAIRRYGPLGV